MDDYARSNTLVSCVPSAKPLTRKFYDRDSLVARKLLGKFLVRRTPKGNIVAKIVEVEAYRGCDDPASHAYKGETPRNRLMFGKPGFTYIYFIYGNHYCLNVTTEREGVPELSKSLKEWNWRVKTEK